MVRHRGAWCPISTQLSGLICWMPSSLTAVNSQDYFLLFQVCLSLSVKGEHNDSYTNLTGFLGTLYVIVTIKHLA